VIKHSSELPKDEGTMFWAASPRSRIAILGRRGNDGKLYPSTLYRQNVEFPVIWPPFPSDLMPWVEVLKGQEVETFFDELNEMDLSDSPEYKALFAKCAEAGRDRELELSPETEAVIEDAIARLPDAAAKAKAAIDWKRPREPDRIWTPLHPLPRTDSNIIMARCQKRLAAGEFPNIDPTKPLVIAVEPANNNQVWLCGYKADGTDTAYPVGRMMGEYYPGTVIDPTDKTIAIHDLEDAAPVRIRSDFELKAGDHLEVIFARDGLSSLNKSVCKKKDAHVGIKLKFGVGYNLVLYAPNKQTVDLGGGIVGRSTAPGEPEPIDLPEFEVRGNSSAPVHVGSTCEVIMAVPHLSRLVKMLRNTPKARKFVGLKALDGTVEVALYNNTANPPEPLATVH
jgi:hypothetical protein